jgi:lipopolysaccharide/colanic/teichoic acid biosynthesis glycosyltransferase
MDQNASFKKMPAFASILQPEQSVQKFPSKPGNLAKRAIDIIGALIGLSILGCFLPWIAMRIRRDSTGPLFYRGPRLGKHGRPFSILKFRTMYERPESYQGPRITAQDDPRITPFGAWLRATKINELPQFWNVLKGEMSLVGPRPEDPQVVENEWPEEMRSELLSLRPGITSPATVLYSDEESLLSASKVMETYLVDVLPSKQRLDQLYVRHHSLAGDLDVIFWTLLVMLPRLGSFKPPEKQLFLGPVNSLIHRFFNWFMIDLAVALGAIGLTGLFWRSFGPLDVGWVAAILLAVGFALVFSLFGVLLGVNRVAWSNAPATDAIDLLLAAGLAGGLVALVNAYLPVLDLWPGVSKVILLDRPMLPAGLIVMASVLALVGFVALRYRQRLLTGLAARWVALRNQSDAGRERVLVVGGGETGQFAAWMLTSGHYADAFKLVGFIDDDLFKQGIRIHGLNVIGQRADIPRLVAKHDIGLIIFAIHNIAARERQHLLEICAATPSKLVVMPDIPGALNTLVAHGGNRQKQARNRQSNPGDVPSATPAEGIDTLPCALCLTRVTPLKVDRWLADLEEISQTGDLEQIHAQLHTLREAIHDDAQAQWRANQV